MKFPLFILICCSLLLSSCITNLLAPGGEACDCNNPFNYSLAGENYTVENVTIFVDATGSPTFFGPWFLTSLTSGQIYDAAGNSLTLPLATTATIGGGAANTYQVQFWHKNGEGYDAIFSNGTETYTIANDCELACADPVPTVSEWGLTFILLMLLSFSLITFLNRKTKAQSLTA